MRLDAETNGREKRPESSILFQIIVGKRLTENFLWCAGEKISKEGEKGTTIFSDQSEKTDQNLSRWMKTQLREEKFAYVIDEENCYVGGSKATENGSSRPDELNSLRPLCFVSPRRLLRARALSSATSTSVIFFLSLSLQLMHEFKEFGEDLGGRKNFA